MKKFTPQSNSVPEMSRIIEERREIAVYVGGNGHVCIKQDQPHQDDIVIWLHPDDVPLLVKYLQETQAEAYLFRASEESQPPKA